MKTLVIGATNIDITSKISGELNINDKNIGVTNLMHGGVGRNIVENLAALNIKSDFLTTTGADILGNDVVKHLELNNIKVYNYKSNLPTGTFLSILDSDSNSVANVSSMEISEQFYVDEINQSYELIVFDLNFEKIIPKILEHNCKIFVDTTSITKCRRIYPYLNNVSYLKCTKEEYNTLFKNKSLDIVLKDFPHLTIFITDGSNPVVYNDHGEIKTLEIESTEVINPNGAGDAFSAGLIYGIIKKHNIDDCVKFASKIAKRTVESIHTVIQKVSEINMVNVNDFLELSEEVKNALENNIPIVSLESTIISHGMAYPHNLKVAQNCEQILRKNGCVPATIFIKNGKIKIGATDEELKELALAKGVVKTSKKDLAYVLANKLTGATTVATTMMASHLAGIQIFATGGIGGVHRGASETFDISADLEILANTPVCVIAAGIKSILDLPMTMEYLETKGVEVYGYKTSILPEFYTLGRDIKVNYKVETPCEIANILKVKKSLNISSGTLIANPIPKEYAMDYDIINNAINSALAEMEENNISGFEATPFLLGKVADITKGKSLKSNISLVFNNVALAAQIAKEM